ncbi:hypothetical protein FOA43_002025 [Brettanomyces nanus]|uniref:Uncharacterized protein n=1 Tax=Eeniella nana TaxID=13502 RepID=A0A875S3Q4_EENNA|nr:uncharacterized protein FOA43_002025 [Brettanomyces nanus]QPG74692.1 hypothetical protein FOA43_002025 [Brettanomyces nanus]
MVSKLSFKGETKRKKHGHKKRKIPLLDSERFSVNNELVTLGEIDRNRLKRCNWTTAANYDDIKDGEPVLIAMERKDNLGVINVTDGDKVTISKESSLQVKSVGECINFTNGASIDLANKVQRVEPTLPNQVLIAVDVENLVTNGDKNEHKVKYIALKDGRSSSYLSHDPETHLLTLSKVLTDNEIFKLEHVPSARSNFSICIKANNDYKLIVTDQLVLRVIEDPENLLDDLNNFNIRVQLVNSEPARKIIDLLNGENHNKDEDTEERVSSAVKELIKAGIKVTNQVLRETKRAARENWLNEYIVELKEKTVTDRGV